MVIPRLVVLTGYPRAGKSTVSERLADHGFTIVATDQIRKRLFGTSSISVQTHMNELLVGQTLGYELFRALYNRKDVVIDATNFTEWHRLSALYLTEEGLPVVDAQRYLLWIDAKRSVLNERALNANRGVDALSHWDAHWQDPVSKPIYELIKYQNNTEDDRAKMLDDLDIRFCGYGQQLRLNY